MNDKTQYHWYLGIKDHHQPVHSLLFYNDHDLSTHLSTLLKPIPNDNVRLEQLSGPARPERVPASWWIVVWSTTAVRIQY